MRANSTRGGTNVHIIGVLTNEANTNINTGLYNNFLYTFTYTGNDDKKNKILIDHDADLSIYGTYRDFYGIPVLIVYTALKCLQYSTLMVSLTNR